MHPRLGALAALRLTDPEQKVAATRALHAGLAAAPGRNACPDGALGRNACPDGALGRDACPDGALGRDACPNGAPGCGPGLDGDSGLATPVRVPGDEAGVPGRPERPLRVSATEVEKRSPFTQEGRAALIHSICHIEFNAIKIG